MKRFRGIWGIIPILSLGFVVWAWRTSLAETESAGIHTVPEIVFVETPTVAPGPLAKRFPQGSHLVLFTRGRSPASVTNLTPDFFAVADPQVSFEATSILFAGQKSRGSRWQIWEMSANGSGTKQLTHCPGNCFQPVFLPQNEMAFTVVMGKGLQRSSAIYVSKQDGTRAHPITFGPGNFEVEAILHSGRLLVSAGSSLVAGVRRDESRRLYTLRTDGSGLYPFRPESALGSVPTTADQLRDGTVVLVKWRDPAGQMTGGHLVWIPPGALHDSALSRPGSVYWSAHVLDGSRLIVAKANSSSSGVAGKFGLYTFNLATKTVGKPIFSDPRLSSVEAVPLEAHRVPLEYYSILHPDRDYARVVCLDAYLSQGTPHGRLDGHIAQVRVIALKPDHHTQRILGEAPVESDGSFYIEVPADIPIRYELLRADGTVIRAQKSWTWVRTGEDVPCLGCHESKAIVPTNHWPQALKVPGAPFPVGVASNRQSGGH